MKARKRGMAWTLVLVLALTLAPGLPAGAADGKAPSPRPELSPGEAHLGKIAPPLRDLMEPLKETERRRVQRVEKTGLSLVPLSELARMKGDLPEIEIRLRKADSSTVEELKALGVEILEVYEKYGRIYAVCEPKLYGDIAAISQVSGIYPNYKPRRSKGATTSQGDRAMGADEARYAFGADGSGVRVGVLSDSFNDFIGGSVSGSGCNAVLAGSDPQNSGDLPAEVFVLDNGPGEETEDEGAGMAEIVHDLAPGADILFHTAWRSEAGFAEGIDALRQCGADVLVDDVSYSTEPFFQDGLVSQAARRAVENGIPYFTSAGNASRNGVDQFYTPAVDDNGTEETFHDFGGGKRFAAVTIPPGCGIEFILQWNEPFDGVLGPGASSDYALSFYDSPDPADFLFETSWVQGCSYGPGETRGDPLEITQGIENDGPEATTLYMAVERRCGSKDVRFRVVTTPECYDGGIAFDEDVFNAPVVYGHAAARDVASIAAVDYREIEANGDFQPPAGTVNVEPFSSLGGDIPYYFDGEGNPLPGAPVTVFKPDVAGPDGVNTTFFGGSDPEDDGFPNFYGTSASAPHVRRCTRSSRAPPRTSKPTAWIPSRATAS